MTGPQNHTDEKLAAGLMEAMRAEHEGFHFYSMAANSTPDEKGKEIFNQLADDERIHLEFLKSQYISIQTKGGPDLDVSLGPITKYNGPSPIFSDAIRTRIKDAHFEMTALSIGIQLELDAVKHYSALAESVNDDRVREFFKELAEWENGHYETLVAQQETLKESYWTGNSFVPF